MLSLRGSTGVWGTEHTLPFTVTRPAGKAHGCRETIGEALGRSLCPVPLPLMLLCPTALPCLFPPTNALCRTSFPQSLRHSLFHSKTFTRRTRQCSAPTDLRRSWSPLLGAKRLPLLPTPASTQAGHQASSKAFKQANRASGRKQACMQASKQDIRQAANIASNRTRRQQKQQETNKPSMVKQATKWAAAEGAAGSEGAGIVRVCVYNCACMCVWLGDRGRD